jgi:hypothetical protein
LACVQPISAWFLVTVSNSQFKIKSEGWPEQINLDIITEKLYPNHHRLKRV